MKLYAGRVPHQAVAGWQWRMAFALVVLLLLAAAGSRHSLAADVAPKVITSATPALIESQLKKINFPFTQPKDGVYYASILTSDVKFLVKNNGTFLALSFAVKAPPGTTLDKMNAFNRDQFFARAYLDNDNDPRLEAELDLEGGVSEDAVGRFFLRFASSISTFADALSK